MSAELPTLAEQALANLVDQFARPLDFLRELAQNAIDAGSPRIDVSVAWDPPRPGEAHGVVRISVDDTGEGMDEDVIDHQLTRLFASSKEHDLTKIGKFGIGFTSIFAIRPEAVLLRTGRHGEYWELLFHPDRTFDKVRIEEPVAGTKITLFKRMPPERVERFVEEVRFVLGYWCEHSDTPITFRDRTTDGPRPPPTDDPFDAFREALPDATARVDRPLALDGALEVRHQQDGIEVVAGFAEPQRFGFYNGGLTLLVTAAREALGPYADRLGHLSFKVKHDRLEHTLTRDNVLHDEHWEQALEAVVAARAHLSVALVRRATEVAAEGGDLGPWHRRLAADLRAPASTLALASAPVLRDVSGRTMSLADVHAEARRTGHVLVASGRSPLVAALEAQGVRVVADHPDTRALVEATDEAPLFEFLFGRRRVRDADEVFVLPALVDPTDLDPLERGLVERATELLRVAVGLRIRGPGGRTWLRWAPGADSAANRLDVKVGDFGGTDLARDEVLALNGPSDGSVFLRGPGVLRLPAFLSWRCLLVNRHHPLFRAEILASVDHPDLAAFGLASALLHVEGREGEPAHRRMLDEVSDRLAPEPA